MSRFVCVGSPKNTVTDPPLQPGLCNSMQWRPGGVPGKHPAFPMSFQCDTADEAQRIWSVMQPWVLRNHKKAPDLLIASLQADRKMLELGALFNQVTDHVYWAVRLGGGVGVYFSGMEAMSSMDHSSETRFRRAFTFKTFIEAVAGMISPNPPALHPLHDYYPGKFPVQAENIRQIAENQLATLSSESSDVYVPSTSASAPAPQPPSVQSPPVLPPAQPSVHSPVAPPPTQDHTNIFNVTIGSPSTPSRRGGNLSRLEHNRGHWKRYEARVRDSNAVTTGRGIGAAKPSSTMQTKRVGDGG
ncbi:hypothetical protein K435DRAFT_798271 [Dendrothele bispora CBS 962.96]|uniref:Uncharacterized protein n=1 Tax=Dendrothele bispora (strain CBS 962.96) TaxID=1314807 RepID=A0A4V4HFK4_DENBC|nr:hypothetical protein K435DRAFT_798271 [Dendrothele bispora CBS 962.96]